LKKIKQRAATANLGGEKWQCSIFFTAAYNKTMDMILGGNI